MPNFRLPLSGDVLQNINPWNWFFKLNGSQVGLFNINLGRSADPELEQEILDEVAEIDEKWAAKADAVDTVPIRLEAGDVRVVQTTLVWVRTA